MKQFGKIFNFELKYYLKNKVFVGVTVFFVLAIAAVMFFPRFAGFFKAEEGAEAVQEKSAVMLLKAELPEQQTMLQEMFAAAFPDYDVQASEMSVDEIKDKITSGEAECAFVMTDDTTYTYYVDNLSMYDMNTSIAGEVLQKVYQMNVMLESGMTAEQAAAVMSVQIAGSVENHGADQTQNFWYTYIMIFALYMVILLYGQMVATNVATEKSSRAMEVLITSAKPVSMMFGKVLASCLAGLLQIVAVFGSAILFYSMNKEYWGDNYIIASIFDMPAQLFGFMLIFFVLGFLIYAFMFGAVGSTASKLEDINTSVMPITLLFVAGFMVAVRKFMTVKLVYLNG